MPRQKKQLHRLKRIAALLKENRYPNSQTLIQEFARMELEENLDIACGKKTILRDMEVLEKEFNCPLAFDRKQNGYYLKHHGWDFISPALLDENEMLAAVTGARIAEKIFPAPLKNRIREAVDYLLQNNNPAFLDSASMSSMNILSGLYVSIDPEIFMTMFQGWQNRRCVEITYSGIRGEYSQRIIEPHTLVFFNNSWYTKAFCHAKNEPRTFALQRIKAARLLENDDFEINMNIVNSVDPDNFLEFAKVRNVKLRVSGFALDHLKAVPLHSQQKIHADNTVDIPAVAKEVLFPFILSQQGAAVLISPIELREELSSVLQAMLTKHLMIEC